MFSQRLTMNLGPNRLHRVLEEKKTAGVNILDLTESNPTRAGFFYDEPKLLRVLADAKSLLYEPDPHGLMQARMAIAGYYAERGETIDPASLFLTASTSEAYAYLFKLLANPGDEILAPLPCYPLLDFLAALESVALRHYPLRYDGSGGWQIDLETLAHVITTKTKAIALVHPNNPTGSFIKAQELARLNELCIEYDLALICDEVFLDYARRHEEAQARSLAMNRGALTFVLSGLSKICALPQMKLSWIHVNGPQAFCKETIDRLEFIADTYLSTSTPVQHAAQEFLAMRRQMQAQIQDRIEANEIVLREMCQTRPQCKVLPREGGWYAVVEIPSEIREEKFVVALLEQENVFVHPGYFFDFPRPGFLILSLLTTTAVFCEGLGKILARLESDHV